MADELQITTEQWDLMLAKQMAKQKVAAKTTRSTVSAKKPGPEKSFVSTHYLASGQSDADTQYKTRDPQTYVVLHFYLRDGDSFQPLCKDARDYAQMFPHSKIIAHDHSFDQPCSPSPKQQKCREV